MFLLWSLAIFISSFNSIFSLQVKYIPNCVYNLKTLKYYNLSSTSASNEDINCDCLPLLPLNLTDFSNLNFTKIMICLLKCWKSDSTKFKIFVEIAKLIINTEILDKNISTFSKIDKLIYNIKTLKYYNLSSTSASNEDINCDCLSPLPSNWTDFSNLIF